MGLMSRIAWKLTASWMVAFAALHVYWGMGGTLLLPAGTSVVDSSALFAIDLLAITVCFAGAAMAWTLRPGLRLAKLSSRRWVVLPATVGAAVMVSHALTGAAILAGRPLFGTGPSAEEVRYLMVYEPCWLIGGVLLALTVRGFGHGLRQRQSLHRKSLEARALATAAQTSSTSQAAKVA